MRARTLFLALLLAAPAPAQEAKKDEKVPDGYFRRDINGFTVYIDKEIQKLNNSPQFKAKPMDILVAELNLVYNQFGKHVMTRLQRNMRVWVEWDRHYPSAPRGAIAFYNHRDRERGRVIVISQMQYLVKNRQPGVVNEGKYLLLHEFAHAVHLEYFGGWDARIKETYGQAMERGLYHSKGKPRYAATSHLEYFAELTVAYLGKLNYHPQTWKELAQYDPPGHKLMKEFWTAARDGTLNQKAPAAAEPKAVADAAPSPAKEREAATRLGLIKVLIDLGKAAEGQRKLEELVRDYPGTAAAREAEGLLKK
jgi:hypothetical protein